MKFLYVGDLHQDELEPVNRVDDFNETRKEKISEIMSIARDNQVKAILHGGDFFNRPKMSNEFVTSVMETWNQKLIPIDIQDLTFKFQAGTISEQDYMMALHQYKTGNIPFISIIGNHDLIGESMESYPKTSLNVLETSGFLHIVDKDNPVFFQDENISVAITGTHYDRNIDRGTDKSGYCIEEKAQINGKPVDFQIHMVHGMLTDHSYGKKFAHTVVVDIADDTKADLTINGHDHIGFPVMEKDGKLFVNPGSPFRLTADKKEIARMPKVMMITIDEHGVQLEDIYLKCAKAGDEVLSTEGKKNKQQKQSVMARIQSIINQSSLNKGLRIADIIDNIGQAQNIEPDTLKDVQNKIIKSMTMMQPDFSPSGEYYITRVELENFLSHKKSAFDFEPGLNVIVGVSRAGKSAVLRALREVLTCYLTQPRKAIFFGASYFSISVYTSNGYIVTRKVERDEKKGFNGYIVYDPITGIETKYNTKSVPLIQEILGYKKIPLTEKKQVDINSVIQGDGWFFVGNTITSPDKARLLGAVYGTHYADVANKEIATDMKRVNAQLTVMKKDVDHLTKQKANYAYLPKLEQSIEDAEKFMEQLDEEAKKIANIKFIYTQMQALEKEIKSLTEAKKQLSQDLRPYLNTLQEQNKVLSYIKQVYNAMQDVTSQGKKLRPVSNALKSISELNVQVADLRDKETKLKKQREEYAKCVDITNKMNNIQKEKNNLNQVVASLQVIPDAKAQYKVMEDAKKNLDVYRENVKKVLDMKKNMDNLQKQMDKCNRDINSFKTLPEMQAIKTLVQQAEVINKAKEIYKNMDATIKEGSEQRKQFNTQKQKNLSNLEEYRKMLESVGECPACHNGIDNVIVEKLVQSHLDKINAK